MEASLLECEVIGVGGKSSFQSHANTASHFPFTIFSNQRSGPRYDLPSIKPDQPTNAPICIYLICQTNIPNLTCTALPLRPLAFSTSKPNTNQYESRIHTHYSLHSEHLTIFAASEALSLRPENLYAAPMLLSFTTGFLSLPSLRGLTWFGGF
jgi:hypothetical protein